MVNATEQPPTVLILGGGEFGLAFAYSLSQSKKYEGFTHLITVIDRSVDPPGLDAASSDYNKIIRSDYSDPFYSSLASQALIEWRKPEYAPYYFESGTVIASSSDSKSGSEYVASSLCLNQSPSLMVNGIGPTALRTTEEFQELYPGGFKCGMGIEEELKGYVNPNCGWADARMAMEHLCRKVRAAGVNFLVGEVTTLLYTNSERSEVNGITTKDGRTINADRIVVALGAWSSKLVPELSQDLLATGQYVGHIQLTPEETLAYSKTPVTFFLDSGFYCFPPTASGILKIAIHGPGYLNPTSTLASTPRTFVDYPEDQIPMAAQMNLRKELNRVYPDLVERHWSSTRLCWYTDSPTSNWLISPSHSTASSTPSSSLFYATAGSGHAFKFLPLLGNLILKSFNSELSLEESKRFGFKGLKRLEGGKGDASRGGLVGVVREILEL